MTAQSPDLNCALYLWRLQVYNDYNVTSMEALLTLLKDTKNPSHKYVPPSLLSGGKSASPARDVKFTDMYPPYEDLGALQGLMAIAIVVADVALLLWIVGSLVFFWRSAIDVICNPLDGRYIVYEAMEGALKDLLAAYIAELEEGSEGGVNPHGRRVPTDKNNE
ncbi:unnamed protein product [Taenia asiatica]|uniref:Autophagy-related protein 9 n=1 Tax=Taenia asiatica TaxID=60517 RepID=A0A0R3WCN1_TAEAS|nr:unnamed protein product [Taenia asiatica]